MRFDPGIGFDPEAHAAIAEMLPIGAEVDNVLNALEWIAHNYQLAGQRDPAAERERHERGLAAIEAAGAYLRHERKHPTLATIAGSTPARSKPWAAPAAYPNGLCARAKSRSAPGPRLGSAPRIALR